MKNIYFAFFQKDKSRIESIISVLEKDKEVKDKNLTFTLISQDNNDFIILADNLKAKIEKDNFQSCGIIFDEYGIAASMYLNKFHKFVVASLTDEHSSYMTRFHNNSNVIALGFENLALERMRLIIKEYLIASFEAGRHLVRIDMLNKMC
ncbi:RpiB/LacA/LacB family sugar-phosphate isomerase [Mycoplasma sp. SG1]|uniref:RpiB/LacA/LacB family sugar-phosphate isomerase n=1 Tax=Mycoplasma sp. SG1 TaxID=2810348 RepID=UPI00202422AD|nr:RpiB/LacA/LacB family sugar-phosphate isomerase [Mycoplasma sp. SG1]URM53167.1 RpiB/LacA/LacB family sugar-phosphate isomerase [Mycoplasma sp. SG1]